jgi:small nuclear ribonucleoprotein (snRNP)-like protein
MATTSASASAAAAAGIFLPLNLMEKCIGSKLVCLLTDGGEIEGTLAAHDSTCTVVLTDATAFDVVKRAPKQPGGFFAVERRPTRTFKRVVVCSRQIQVLVPGGLPQAEASA